MAVRTKRSISLPPELDQAIEHAAAVDGLTVSAWLARTIEHRLRIDAGIEAVELWEAEHGRLTDDEMAEARKRLAGARDRSARGAARA
jgi:hypothetical protein